MCICRSRCRPATCTADTGSATTCLLTASSRSTSRPATGSGTTRRFTTTSGLRPAERPDPGRHHGRWTADQGGRPAEQAGVPLCARPHERRAGLADRRTAGATIGRAGRGDVADAAVPDKAAAVRPSRHQRRRPDRFHPGAAGPRRGDHRPLPDRPALHAAVGRLVRGYARHAAHPGADGRIELAGRVVRPGDRHLLHLLEDRSNESGACEQSRAVEHGLHHGPTETTGGRHQWAWRLRD